MFANIFFRLHFLAPHAVDQVIPTEGGHADFAPRGDLQRDLTKFIAQGPKEINPDHPGLCEVEDILCGQVSSLYIYIYVCM